LEAIFRNKIVHNNLGILFISEREKETAAILFYDDKSVNYINLDFWIGK